MCEETRGRRTTEIKGLNVNICRGVGDVLDVCKWMDYGSTLASGHEDWSRTVRYVDIMYDERKTSTFPFTLQMRI